jgi:phosphonate degradation associated HDIG domain protein
MSEASSWQGLDSAEAVADALIDYFERRGDDRYDESVTQTAHARQCGALALAGGADAATVAAGFLHDIGHLLMHDIDRRRDLHHELVGSRFLCRWFGPAVTEPIRLHVPAKRYLCATSPGYHADLSPASIASLALQGGPMSGHEVAAFEADPVAMTAVDLRRWDDLAKVPDAPAPSLDDFRAMLIDLIDLGEMSDLSDLIDPSDG